MSTLPEAPAGATAAGTAKAQQTPSLKSSPALPAEAEEVAFDIRNFSMWYGTRQALQDVTIKIPARR